MSGIQQQNGGKAAGGLVDRIAGVSGNGLMWLACAAITLMMLHVTADVIGKKFFSQPMPATLETVRIYYMVALVFLPFTYIARGEGHIVVELFTRNLSPRRQAAINAAMGVLTLVWMVLLAWYGGEEAVTTTLDGELEETADGFLISWPSRWFVPLGCGVMALAVIVRMAQDIQAARGRGSTACPPSP